MASATIGLVLLFLAWQQWQYYPNILKNGKETGGTVIEMHRDPGAIWRNQEGDGEAPIVEFVDHEGRTHRHVSGTYQWPSHYKVGQKVRVWYIIHKSRREFALADDSRGSTPANLLKIGLLALLLGAPELWKRLSGFF